MGIGAERYGSRADLAAFAACLVASLVVLALPEALRLPVAGALRRSVLAPALVVERQAARAREARRNLGELREQRDSLAIAAEQLPVLEAENARLRALLRLGERVRGGYVTAEVLHQTGLAEGLTLLLSAGRRQGVVPLSPVVAPTGLVGMVLTVDVRSSVAMAWTHPDFKVGAMVADGRILGVVASRRGETAGEVMELRGIPYRAALPPGTPVVTSGVGGVFPRGIPLGTVQGVLSESAGWERTYLLKPAVHPGEVSHVMVLSPAHAADTLTAAFDTSAAFVAPAPPAPPAPRPRRAHPAPVPEPTGGRGPGL